MNIGPSILAGCAAFWTLVWMLCTSITEMGTMIFLFLVLLCILFAQLHLKGRSDD